MAGSYRISAHTTAALVSMKEQDLASDECPGEQRISDQAVSSILSQGLNAPTRGLAEDHLGWGLEGTPGALRTQVLVWLPIPSLSRCPQFLAAPGSVPLAKATYPGKARAGPGSEPTDKK